MPIIANKGGGEGGWVIKISQSFMVGSGKYYRDTTKILHPPPVINTGRLADSSSRESFVFVYINQSR